jgi:hypothetical protein
MLPSFSWGTANLAGGTVTVSDSSVQAGSLIFLTRISPAGTLGSLGITAISPGASFTVTSSSPSETSQIGYLVKI